MSRKRKQESSEKSNALTRNIPKLSTLLSAKRQKQSETSNSPEQQPTPKKPLPPLRPKPQYQPIPTLTQANQIQIMGNLYPAELMMRQAMQLQSQQVRFWAHVQKQVEQQSQATAPLQALYNRYEKISETYRKVMINSQLCNMMLKLVTTQENGSMHYIDKFNGETLAVIFRTVSSQFYQFAFNQVSEFNL